MCSSKILVTKKKKEISSALNPYPKKLEQLCHCWLQKYESSCVHATIKKYCFQNKLKNRLKQGMIRTGWGQQITGRQGIGSQENDSEIFNKCMKCNQDDNNHINCQHHLSMTVKSYSSTQVANMTKLYIFRRSLLLRSPNFSS